MARPKRIEDDMREGEENTTPPLRKQVRIKHYKLFTSQGRFIAGQLADLPASEADEIIAKGHAVAV